MLKETLMVVLVRVTIALMKHETKSKLKRNGFRVYTSKSQFLVEGSQEGTQVEQGPGWRQELL